MRVRTIGELTTTAVPLSRTAGSTLSADPCGNNFMSCAVRLALLYSVMQVACGLLLLMPMCYLTKGVFILSLLGLLQPALQSGPTLRSHRSCPTVRVVRVSLAPCDNTCAQLRENQALAHTQRHAHDPRIRDVMCVRV